MMTSGSTTQRPAELYEAGTSVSGAAYAAALSRLPTGVSRQTLVYKPYPLFADRGQGQYLWDVDGNRYTDFVNNYTSLIHGHAHRPSVEAAAAELWRGGALGAPTKLELEFAEDLIGRYPVIEQLRFALSGSEAITYAIRCARAFTGRRRVLKFEGGFHGNHDEVQQSIATEPLPAGTFGYGQPGSQGLMAVETLVAVYNDRDSVAAAFERHGEEIAVVVAEPFLGNSGLVAAATGFLDFVCRVAHEHGALLLVDEIQSMRLAPGGAQQLHSVRPDIVTLGKIMGGGLPLAAFGASREIMSVLDGFTPSVPQTGTFNAFSAALAAGMASMAAFDDQAVSRLNAMGSAVRAGISQIFAEKGVPVTVNGQGSMFNVCLREGPVGDYRAWRSAPTELWTELRMGLLTRFHYIMQRGTGCLSTPMVDADIDRFLGDLDEALSAALASGNYGKGRPS
jgi:glutamate-1-semialdehyde 2,1-aminomutase